LTIQEETVLFDGRVAVVTGSGSGIGRQVILDMACEAARVVVTDVNAESVSAVAAEVRQLGGECLAEVCDVSDGAQVEALMQKALAAFGRVDILVNNAGLLVTGTIEETSDDIIDRTLDINVKGVLYCIRAVTPIMKKQRYGKIISLSSITGKNGDNSTVFVYGASKGAVMSLTRSAARQLGPYGINVNAVAPHAVMTSMMRYWDEERKKRVADQIPLRRLATVEDVSSLIVFLASEKSSFITGETINVNGGYYMD
jgi:3-oxoacyl-[acyl-carrier protein] reductase